MTAREWTGVGLLLLAAAGLVFWIASNSSLFVAEVLGTGAIVALIVAGMTK